MPCYHPLRAYQQLDGSILFEESKGSDVRRGLRLPCGQCIGCRLERSRQWAVRCMHEASLYKENCFITLTYNDENLPEHLSLQHEDFQKFMKRFRKAHSGTDMVIKNDKITYPIRYYMAGEYGESGFRPHYHACIFNFDFPDKKFFKRTKSGSPVFRSDILEDLWPHGFSSIGEVNFQSAAYVARYIMKKRLGKDQAEHYADIDYETGELFQRCPEYNRMSLRPGIADVWFQKFRKDVYPDDFVIVNGRKVRPPKYYDKKLQELDSELFEEIALDREFNAYENRHDNTHERLQIKEKVQQAKLNQLKRELK